MAKMDEDDLLTHLQALESDAADFVSSTLAPERQKSESEYFRQPYGTEDEGWSSIVTSDVQDTVEWMLPDLLDIFTSTDQAVVFEPTQAKDVAGAQQATDACNYVFYKQNNGFLVLYTAFKDALLRKNCAVMWRRDIERVKTIIPVNGATAEMLAMLLEEAGEDAQLESAEQAEQPKPPPMPMAPPGGPQGPPPGAGPGQPPGMPPQGPGGPGGPGMAPQGPPQGMPPGPRGFAPNMAPGGRQPVPPPGGMPPGGPQGPPPGMRPGAVPQAAQQAAMPQGMPMPGPVPPMPMEPPEPLFNARISVVDEKVTVRVESFAPDDLLVQRDWTSPFLQQCPYVCRSMEVTLSDLQLMGFDDVTAEELAASAEPNPQDDTDDRRGRIESSDYDESNEVSKEDESQTKGYMRIEYILVDFDGDGIAERREIYRLQDKILRNEECEQVPIATTSPVLVPHHWDGMSVAEMVSDIQQIKTELARQMLNNAYLANNPRKKVLTDANWSPLANIDDLLDGRPGGVLRQRQVDAITIDQTPWVGGQMFPMLEYIDDMHARRTGISKQNTGIDPNTLKNDRTATEIQMTSTAARQRIRLIARVMAETLLKPIFQGILKLLTNGLMKPMAFRLNGNFVEYDPNEWRDNYDMTINVGLGTGDRQQQAAQLMAIAQAQMGLAQTPFGQLLIAPQQVYNTQAKMVENAGYKNVNEFFIDPKGAPMPPQQPPPQPQVEAAQIKAQADSQQAIAKAQHDAQIEQLRQAAKDQESKNQLALQASNDQRDAERAQLEAQYKAQLDAATMEFNRWKADLDSRTKILVAQIEAGAKTDGAELGAVSKAHATETQAATQMHSTETQAATTMAVAERNAQAKEKADANRPKPKPGGDK